jgi:hypothetical protein
MDASCEYQFNGIQWILTQACDPQTPDRAGFTACPPVPMGTLSALGSKLASSSSTFGAFKLADVIICDCENVAGDGQHRIFFQRPAAGAQAAIKKVFLMVAGNPPTFTEQPSNLSPSTDTKPQVPQMIVQSDGSLKAVAAAPS